MKSENDRQIDRALSGYAEQEIRMPEAETELPHIFPDGFYIKRRKMVRRKRPHPAAAAAAVIVILVCGISVGAFWEELHDFTMEAKDKFFAFFSAGAEREDHLTESLRITEVPVRFELSKVDKESGVLIFYAYSSESGDMLNVFEEIGSQELQSDNEVEYESLQISVRDVYLGYKAAENTYNIYFRYDHETTVSIVGNITRDEAIQIITAALNK